MDYKTVHKEAHAEVIEKKSRFIAHVFYVTTEEEALSKLEEIRLKYYDATHNVYGYRLRAQNLARFSDDGEPSQSAGMPVLDVIQKSGIYDVLIVVTRYFGGTLLGVGGLVRTYTAAVKAGLDEAGIINMIQSKVIEISIAYPFYGKVKNVVQNCGGVIDDVDYTTDVKIRLHIRENEADHLISEITQATNAQAVLQIIEERYFEYTGMRL